MKRDSRFELLRIISMFLIILFHFEYFSQSWRLNYSGSLIDDICQASFLPLGKIGVYLFIMITGYFVGIKPFSIKKSLNKVYSIWTEAFFYSVIIFFLMVIFHLTKYSLKENIIVSLPFVTNQYWFVDSYIILLLLIPFINICIIRITQRQFIYLIFVVALLGSFLTSIKNYSFSSEISFGYIIPPYLIGAYIRKYGISISRIKLKICSTYALLILCTTIFYHVKEFKSFNIMYFGVFELLISTMLFVYCTQQSTYHNQLINTVAKTVFASYLITDNMFIKAILWNLPLLHSKGFSLFQINLLGILVAIILLLLCSFIDFIRLKIFELCKINRLLNIK